MRLSLTGGAIAVILLIAVIVGYGTFFTVYQTIRPWWSGSASPCASSPRRAST